MVRSRTLTPGRPSGVSSGASSHSIPASHLQPMTEVAKPVILSAASRTQRGLRAVITTRATRMVNASAKVSSMATPRMSTSALLQRGVAQPPHREVVEGDRAVLVVEAAQVRHHGIVVARRETEAPARRRAAELPLLDHQRSALDDVPRQREHPGQVGFPRVYRHVGVGADTEVSLAFEAE